MSANTDLVRDFCAVWPEMDLDRILGYFAPDAVYRNIPIEPPNEGIDAIRRTLGTFLGMAQRVEFVVHHIAESADGVVMTERTDRFLMNERWAEAPVMGVFEVADGKIRAWRDYFDLAQFMKEIRQE